MVAAGTVVEQRGVGASSDEESQYGQNASSSWKGNRGRVNGHHDESNNTNGTVPGGGDVAGVLGAGGGGGDGGSIHSAYPSVFGDISTMSDASQLTDGVGTG